jgi:hypothetical protein
MSFDEMLPSDRDRGRYLLGDTTNDQSTELLTDNAVDAALLQYGYAGGVAYLAEGLAARFAQQVSSTSLPGGLSASWSERVKYWLGLADRMRKLGGVTASGQAFSHTPARTDGYSEYAEEQL